MSTLIWETNMVRRPGKFEISWKRWGLALQAIFDGSMSCDYPGWMLNFHLGPLNVFLHLSFRYAPKSKRESWEREWQRWGFYFMDDSLWMRWNERSIVWYLPWFHKVFQRHEVRRADGSWVDAVGSWEQKEPDGREYFTFHYLYRLRSGTVQQTYAKVSVQRRAWRPKWFQWTSLFEMCIQSIDVEFDSEVGERSGSWKGGVIGCSYEMMPGETAERTLRRMERERVFS